MISVYTDIRPEIVALVADEIANTSGPITIRISSSGGDAVAALAAYQLLKASGRPVRAEVVGICASAATVLAMAASERVMSPTALIMIHAPWMTTSGSSSELIAAAKVLDSVESGFAAVYAEALGIDAAAAASLMQQGDKWFDASAAIAQGIATGTLQTPQKIAAKMKEQKMNPWKTLLAKINGKPEISEEVRAAMAAEIKAQITAEEAEELTDLKTKMECMEASLATYQEQVTAANAMKDRITELEAKATADEATKEEAVAKVEAIKAASSAIVTSGLTVAAFNIAINKPTAAEILAAIESGEKIKAPEAIKKTEASGKLQVYASISDPVERQKFLAEHKAEIEAEKLSLKTR